jgi:hypothetical protein
MGTDMTKEPVYFPVLPHIHRAARIQDLQRTLGALLAGHPDVPATVTAGIARRLETEIEMLLRSDVELARILRALQGQPAVAASISRPAAAKKSLAEARYRRTSVSPRHVSA